MLWDRHVPAKHRSVNGVDGAQSRAPPRRRAKGRPVDGLDTASQELRTGRRLHIEVGAASTDRSKHCEEGGDIGFDAASTDRRQAL